MSLLLLYLQWCCAQMYPSGSAQSPGKLLTQIFATSRAVTSYHIFRFLGQFHPKNRRNYFFYYTYYKLNIIFRLKGCSSHDLAKCWPFALLSDQENFAISVVEALYCEISVLRSTSINIAKEIEKDAGNLIAQDIVDGTMISRLWLALEYRTKHWYWLKRNPLKFAIKRQRNQKHN